MLNSCGYLQAWEQQIRADQGTKISICTTCKDRNDLLIQAYKTWVRVYVDEIVIVDWNSKIPVVESLQGIRRRYRHPNTKVLEYRGDREFSVPISRNTSVRGSTGTFLFLMDCDIKMNNPWHYFINPYLKSIFYTGFHGNWGSERDPHIIRQHQEIPTESNFQSLNGTSFMQRDMFLEVNGFNECLRGFGYHERCLYSRLMQKGHIRQITDLSGCFIEHIDHPDWRRFSNYSRKDVIWKDNQSRAIETAEYWMEKGIQEKLEVKESIL